MITANVTKTGVPNGNSGTTGTINSGYIPRANMEGERFDPAIHPAEVAIKAVTYHIGNTVGMGVLDN